MTSTEVILDPEGKPLYPTEVVAPVAEELLYHCSSCFSQAEICGFIRRQEKHTYDIGIVSLLNENIFNFSTLLASPPDGIKITNLRAKERKYLFNVVLPNGWKIDCDWHILPNEEQYEVMKLIRTGSRDFIINLEVEAQKKRLYLRHGGRYTLGNLSDAKEFILWGLYGGVTEWSDRINGFETTINPFYRAAWRERDIIVKVFDHYIEPADRI